MEKELDGHGCQMTEKDPQSSAEVQLTNTQSLCIVTERCFTLVSNV